jgi:hypothetical protein
MFHPLFSRAFEVSPQSLSLWMTEPSTEAVATKARCIADPVTIVAR